jgi:hypothetical protein
MIIRCNENCKQAGLTVDFHLWPVRAFSFKSRLIVIYSKHLLSCPLTSHIPWIPSRCHSHTLLALATATNGTGYDEIRQAIRQNNFQLWSIWIVLARHIEWMLNESFIHIYRYLFEQDKLSEIICHMVTSNIVGLSSKSGFRLIIRKLYVLKGG